jgi:hypothetical protein
MQPSRASRAASSFRLDVKGAEVRAAFAATGVTSILLKGRAFTHLLYAGPGERPYGDVDLLVSPGQISTARQTLTDLGFRNYHGEFPSAQTGPALGRAMDAAGDVHAELWVRDRDRFQIDLHDSLPQVGADPATVWRHLSQHIDQIAIAGQPTNVLDPPASALLVALHAAHHGPGWPNAERDLDRAVAALAPECWAQARTLAVALDAESAMGVGLGLRPEGRAIAQRLGLGVEPSRARQLLWEGGSWSAGFLEALKGERGLRARGNLIRHALWPDAAALRRGSALARRGRLGLALAYATRPFQLARRLPAAIVVRRRLSRSR